MHIATDARYVSRNDAVIQVSNPYTPPLCFLYVKMTLSPSFFIYREIVNGKEPGLHVRVMSPIVQAHTTTTGHGANVEMERSVLRVTKFIAAPQKLPTVSCTGREPPRFAVVDVTIVARAMIAY